MYSCAITTFLLLNPKKTNKKCYECNCQKCVYQKYKKQYSPRYSFLKKIIENMERDIKNRKKLQKPYTKEQDKPFENMLVNIELPKKEYNFSNLFILFNRRFSRHLPI